MKRTILSLATALMALAANAQVFVAQDNFKQPERADDFNDAALVMKGGVVANGDTRARENIKDGKYQGMRVEAKKRAFNIGGKTQIFTCCLSTKGPAAAIKEGGVVKADNCPRSRMLQMKPLSSGTLEFAISGSTKDTQGNRLNECKLYVGVRNGSTFRNLAVLDWKQGDAKGTKSSPLPTVSCKYTYTEGDEIYIYGDNNVNIFAIDFSGKLDASFQGSDPVAVNKAVRKARK